MLLTSFAGPAIKKYLPCIIMGAKVFFKDGETMNEAHYGMMRTTLYTRCQKKKVAIHHIIAYILGHTNAVKLLGLSGYIFPVAHQPV